MSTGREPPSGPTEFEDFARNAIEWATAQLGSTEYRFRCLGFVEDAYEISNGIQLVTSEVARESADLYGAAPHAELPPAGALVFYDYIADIRGERKNWGHVGISIGDGKIIHSWDTIRVDNYLDVENLPTPPGFGRPKYIGWASAARVLEGSVPRRTKPT